MRNLKMTTCSHTDKVISETSKETDENIANYSLGKKYNFRCARMKLIFSMNNLNKLKCVGLSFCGNFISVFIEQIDFPLGERKTNILSNEREVFFVFLISVEGNKHFVQ